MRTVRDFDMNRHVSWLGLVPTPTERHLYEEIVHFIESSDSATQARAWSYVNYFLAVDIHRCNMMLEVLSQSGFSPVEGLSAFIELKRKNCLPDLEEVSEWPSLYLVHRRYDSDNKFCTPFFHCFCSETGSNEWMEIGQVVKKYVEVKRGDAFSSAGYSTLVASFDEDGNKSHLAMILLPIRGQKVYLEIVSAVKDGTRPEDLRVELQCAHGKFLRIPRKFKVCVLRYSPAAYAKILEMDEESLFTTGPFSWTRLSEELYSRRLDYRVRVMTIEQALSRGYTNEEVYAGCANDNLASDFDGGVVFRISCADIHPFGINSFSSTQEVASVLSSSNHTEVLDMPPAIATEADSECSVSLLLQDGQSHPDDSDHNRRVEVVSGNIQVDAVDCNNSQESLQQQDILGSHENDPISAPDEPVGGILSVASDAPAEVIDTADRKTIESPRMLPRNEVYSEESQYRLQIAVVSAIALVLGVLLSKYVF
ncbi:hypothetical protein ACEPAH_2687 [Sanghuangporus vaninii]